MTTRSAFPRHLIRSLVRLRSRLQQEWAINGAQGLRNLAFDPTGLYGMRRRWRDVSDRHSCSAGSILRRRSAPRSTREGLAPLLPSRASAWARSSRRRRARCTGRGRLGHCSPISSFSSDSGKKRHRSIAASRKSRPRICPRNGASRIFGAGPRRRRRRCRSNCPCTSSPSSSTAYRSSSAISTSCASCPSNGTGTSSKALPS